MNKREYEALHHWEEKIWEQQPNLGKEDISKCLPGWIKSLCDKFDQGGEHKFSHHAIGNIVHTLMGARVRCYRLIREREQYKLRFYKKEIKMFTVHDLRKMGYTVKVRHNRRYDTKKMGGFAVSPKGGSTDVSVYFGDLLIFSESSHCCGNDNYDRKLGVKIALGRGLKSFTNELTDFYKLANLQCQN